MKEETVTTSGAAGDVAAEVGQPPRRGRGRVWRRFRRHRLALLGTATLIVFTFMAIFAPLVTWHEPNDTDIDALRTPPSWSHILGTDEAGRDQYARVVHAGRVSIAVGLVAAAISTIIGTLLGIVSGYVGGWLDNLIQRAVEIVMMFPTLFALILLVAVIGASVYNIMFIIGILGWTGKTRLVRGQVLSLKEMDFVIGARAVGSGALAHHAGPHPSGRRALRDRSGHADHRGSDPQRGVPQLPRTGRQAADRDVGQHDERGSVPQRPQRPAVAVAAARHRHIRRRSSR